MLLLGKGLNLSQAVGVQYFVFPKQILPQQNERLAIVSMIQMEGLFSSMLGKLAKKKKKLDPFPTFLY